MPDWAKKDINLIKEASRHAEAKMAAQVQLAISADARASILCGVYAAATGTLIVLATSSLLQASHIAVGTAFATALFFMIGSGLCVWAIWPCDFHLPGNEPCKWYDDIENGVSLEQAAGEQLELFDSDISENNETLARNAGRFQAGVLVGMLAPLAGFIFAGILRLLGNS